MKLKKDLLISVAFVTSGFMSLAQQGLSAESTAKELFPRIHASVYSCYERAHLNQGEFQWAGENDESLFKDVYLEEALRILDAGHAPELSKKLKMFSEIKGLSQDQLITLIGCARYLTGSVSGGHENAFMRALDIYDSMSAVAKDVLFTEFDKVYDIFAGQSDRKEDKLIELEKRANEFSKKMSSDPLLAEKFSKMVIADGDDQRSWEFGREVALSSMGVCQEFEAPGFWSGVIGYIGWKWNSFWKK